MRHRHTALMTHDLAPAEATETDLFGLVGVEVDENPPEFSEEEIDGPLADDERFIDLIDDALEERDDDLMLALLDALGVDLDALDEPIEWVDTELTDLDDPADDFAA